MICLFGSFLSENLATQEASITDDGILAFCDALGVDAQDPVMLALSCAMEAETMGVYTRTEFRRGMHKLQCRSIEELRGKIPCLRSQMQERAHFGTIYAVRCSLLIEVWVSFQRASHAVVWP